MEKDSYFADVKEMFAETDRFLKEKFAESDRVLNEKFAKTEQLIDKIANDGDRQRKEDDLKRKEDERIWKENIAESDRQRKEEERIWREKIAKTEQAIDKIIVKTDGINSRVDGIGNSNGKFAEEYFYNSLERTLEFAGVHFDGISNKFGFMKKMPDGKRLKDQFDIVMLNGNSVAIIEIKYKADENDYPQKMVEKKIPNFKLLYPEYAKHKIYLGLGSMSFEDKVIAEAKKFGIGLLKQVGETIEYETEWVRAY